MCVPLSPCGCSRCTMLIIYNRRDCLPNVNASVSVSVLQLVSRVCESPVVQCSSPVGSVFVCLVVLPILGRCDAAASSSPSPVSHSFPLHLKIGHGILFILPCPSCSLCCFKPSFLISQVHLQHCAFRLQQVLVSAKYFCLPDAKLSLDRPVHLPCPSARVEVI